MHTFREEVLNVELARLLSQRQLPANPETVGRKGRPDVLLYLQGVRVVLEGRIESERASLLRDAQERVIEGIADISLAVLYRVDLRKAEDHAALVHNLEQARFNGCIYHFGRQGLQDTEFADKTVDDLAETIRNVFHLQVKNELVAEQVKMVQGELEDIVVDASQTNLFFGSEALVQRLTHVLGIQKDADTTEAED